MPSTLRVQLQLRIVSDDDTVIRDEVILQLDKSGDRLEAIGLCLEDSKDLLGRLQHAVVEAQAAAYVNWHRRCSACGRRLRGKGQYPIVFRTVFGNHPGFRRNHAKGVAVTGYFDGTGEASEMSTAAVLSARRTPVIGRFSLTGGNPYVTDTPSAARGLAVAFDLTSRICPATFERGDEVFEPLARGQALIVQAKATRSAELRASTGQVILGGDIAVRASLVHLAAKRVVGHRVGSAVGVDGFGAAVVLVVLELDGVAVGVGRLLRQRAGAKAVAPLLEALRRGGKSGEGRKHCQRSKAL